MIICIILTKWSHRKYCYAGKMLISKARDIPFANGGRKAI